MSLPKIPSLRLTLITINAAIISVVLFLYTATWMESSMVDSCILGVIFLVTGLTFMILLGVWKRKQGPSKQPGYSNRVLLWVVFCLGAVYIMNWSTTWKTLATNPLGSVAHAQLIGVSEEIFFRGFITPWLIALLGPFFGLLLGAGVFSIYHFQRYGSSTPDLLITFGAGMLLGYAMIETGTLDSSILAHVLVNFVGLGGFLMGGLVGSLTAMALSSVLLLLLLRPKRGGSI